MQTVKRQRGKAQRINYYPECCGGSVDQCITARSVKMYCVLTRVYVDRESAQMS